MLEYGDGCIGTGGGNEAWTCKPLNDAVRSPTVYGSCLLAGMFSRVVISLVAIDFGIGDVFLLLLRALGRVIDDERPLGEDCLLCGRLFCVTRGA
jgi:hypothetical protein